MRVLAHFFDRLIDNRVHAVEMTCTALGSGRFRKGDWVLLAGCERWRVWGYRNDADVILLYRG